MHEGGHVLEPPIGADGRPRSDSGELHTKIASRGDDVYRELYRAHMRGNKKATLYKDIGNVMTKERLYKIYPDTKFITTKREM